MSPPPPPAAQFKVHELRSQTKSDLLSKVRGLLCPQRGAVAILPTARVVPPPLPLLLTHSPCSIQLKDLKQELAALRVAKVTGGAPNKLSKMCVLGAAARRFSPLVERALTPVPPRSAHQQQGRAAGYRAGVDCHPGATEEGAA